MELASMLAGERFTDHPQSVCPVIGSFLRTYNDVIDDERRQDLYSCAAAVVGTRASSHVEDARTARLVEWLHEQRRRRRVKSLVPRPLRTLGRGMIASDAAGRLAVRAISKHTNRSHAEALALIDELVAIGSRSDQSAQLVESGRRDRRRLMERVPARDHLPAGGRTRAYNA